LSRDYFRLRKPLERRLYELARKHCGQQDEWVISLELLKKKCGSASQDYEFRRLLTLICDEDASHGHIPDYAISFDGGNVTFTNRKAMKLSARSDQMAFPLLGRETYHDARTVAPGYDIHICGVHRFLQKPLQPESQPLNRRRENSLFLEIRFSPLPSSNWLALYRSCVEEESRNSRILTFEAALLLPSGQRLK
jgi:hypothetical protein